MRKDAPIAVDLPAPEQDKPGWARISAIAAIGFLIGVAWPRVVGVRLGPSAPGESAAAASASAALTASPTPSASASISVAVSASSVPKAVPAAPPAAVAQAPRVQDTAPSAASALHVTVAKGSVLSCKSSDGETHKGKACGPAPGLDALVRPKLRALASCAGLEGQTGKLSVVVTADFASGKLTHDIGKSSTLKEADVASACLKSALHGVSTPSTAHDYARYTVAYAAVFSATNP
jgi:hypothetical protein